MRPCASDMQRRILHSDMHRTSPTRRTSISVTTSQASKWRAKYSTDSDWGREREECERREGEGGTIVRACAIQLVEGMRGRVSPPMTVNEKQKRNKMKSFAQQVQ